MLPGQDRVVGLFAAVATQADGDRLVAWMRQIEALKKSDFVLQIGHLSQPPQLHDLAGLSLDDDDLADIRRCRPADCALKLGRAEMEELRRAAEGSGDLTPPSRSRFGGWFSNALKVSTWWPRCLARLREQRPGDAARSSSSSNRFAHSQPRLVDTSNGILTAFPDLESFIYWSKERVGPGPIISATEAVILRGTNEESRRSGRDASC
jgi:hypothetical protein